MLQIKTIDLFLQFNRKAITDIYARGFPWIFSPKQKLCLGVRVRFFRGAGGGGVKRAQAGQSQDTHH